MPSTVTKPIDEGDVAGTLELVLKEIVKQNKVCTVLTKSRVVDLGTAEASVELTFDEARCEKVPPKA